MIDFTNCKKSNIMYSGSEEKIGIIYNEAYYMLKFPKIVQGKKTYSHVSEYLASHIIASLGLEVHETLLGLYHGEEVVAVKDFAQNTGYQLIEFNNIGDSSYDTEKAGHKSYEYNEIEYLMNHHIKADIDKIKERFWDMFVADALLANFDRHGYNWGLLKNSKTYMLAPIYDNGSSLFPRLLDCNLDAILNSPEELAKRTFQFPTSQILLNGKKSSYYEVIKSHKFEGCDLAVKRIVARVDWDKINKIIITVPFVSEERKLFYQKILRVRYDSMLGGM